MAKAMCLLYAEWSNTNAHFNNDACSRFSCLTFFTPYHVEVIRCYWNDFEIEESRCSRCVLTSFTCVLGEAKAVLQHENPRYDYLLTYFRSVSDMTTLSRVAILPFHMNFIATIFVKVTVKLSSVASLARAHWNLLSLKTAGHAGVLSQGF